MSKLVDKLPGMYAELHGAGAFRGDSWLPVLHGPYKRFCAEAGGPKTKILDFGCGPTGGIAAHYGDRVIPYDPYVEKYAADPWKSGFKTFFSTDVFEHLPENQLSDLLRRLARHVSCRHVFVALSTRPANKTLPNGLNVHLTIRPPEWWYGAFSAALLGSYAWVMAEADLRAGEAYFGLVRPDSPAPPPPVIGGRAPQADGPGASDAAGPVDPPAIESV